MSNLLTGQQAIRLDQSARNAGIFLVLTALATVVAVVGRVAADADQPTLAQSIASISEHQFLYGLGGAGRLLSGITLIVGGWLLLRTWIIRDRYATSLVPIIFMVSGAFTAVSGLCAILLIAADPNSINSTIETTSTLRWLTGKIGFSAAGLALLVAARYQWMVGQTLRRIAPVSLTLGFAMQLIWLDVGTVIHGIVGTLFFLWLMAIGTMLATGRVERHFTTKFNL